MVGRTDAPSALSTRSTRRRRVRCRSTTMAAAGPPSASATGHRTAPGSARLPAPGVLLLGVRGGDLVRDRPAHRDAPGRARQAVAGRAVRRRGPRSRAIRSSPSRGRRACSRCDGVPGLNEKKVGWLHGIARAAMDGRLDTDELAAMPHEEALASLRALPGVGPFTAEAVWLRGCGVTDELPSTEEASLMAAHEAVRPAGLDRAGLIEIAEAWRPYRMWATVLLRMGRGRESAGGATAPESGSEVSTLCGRTCRRRSRRRSGRCSGCRSEMPCGRRRCA